MVNMNKPILAGGLVHEIPADMAEALTQKEEVTDLWDSLTPIGRNEFICWVLDAKQPKTRARRIDRTVEELLEGKKRPCCWAGCIHRDDKEPSKSQRFIYNLNKKNKD